MLLLAGGAGYPKETVFITNGYWSYGADADSFTYYGERSSAAADRPGKTLASWSQVS
jgi:hypothetical protein